MASFHSKADAAMARKYGPAAWETMPNWGKVRNRIEPLIYERYHRRMMLMAAIIPAAGASVVTYFAIAFLR